MPVESGVPPGGIGRNTAGGGKVRSRQAQKEQQTRALSGQFTFTKFVGDGKKRKNKETLFPEQKGATMDELYWVVLQFRDENTELRNKIENEREEMRGEIRSLHCNLEDWEERSILPPATVGSNPTPLYSDIARSGVPSVVTATTDETPSRGCSVPSRAASRNTMRTLLSSPGPQNENEDAAKLDLSRVKVNAKEMDGIKKVL